MKQSLFAILQPGLRDTVFVDLYAGSGAAGIEALSRGAALAIFVERDHRALACIDGNLRSSRLAERAIVVRTNASAWLRTARERALAGRPAAHVFLDPPYESPADLERSLEGIEAAGPGGVLAHAGTVIAKHFWRTELPRTRLLRSVRQERFGDTALTFLHWADEVRP